LALYAYFKKKTLLSALLIGLSILNKETGILFLGIIIVYETITILHKKTPRWTLKHFSKASIYLLIIFLVFFIPITTYDVIYKPNGGAIKDGFDHINYMENYAGSLKINELTIATNFSEAHVSFYDQFRRNVASATTDSSGRFRVNGVFSLKLAKGNYTWTVGSQNGSFSIPYGISDDNFAWNWIIPNLNSYSPVNYYYILSVNKTSTSTSSTGQYETNVQIVHPIIWYGMGTVQIWWTLWLIVPLTIEKVVRKKASRLDSLLLAWIIGTYGPMLVLSIVFRRIVYPFYFLLTVPALCLGIPYLVKESISSRKARIAILALFFLSVLAVFYYTYPVRIFEQ